MIDMNKEGGSAGTGMEYLLFYALLTWNKPEGAKARVDKAEEESGAHPPGRIRERNRAWTMAPAGLKVSESSIEPKGRGDNEPICMRSWL